MVVRIEILHIRLKGNSKFIKHKITTKIEGSYPINFVESKRDNLVFILSSF